MMLPSWIHNSPFLAVGLLLIVESLMPPMYQPSAWVLKKLIRLYQKTLSSSVPTQCRFHPTCSHYGHGCLENFGTLRGGLLTVWRILRCHPFAHGGDDPVPPVR